jgi:hypothetical protein
MRKITAPAGHVLHGPYDTNRPHMPWWVHGVLYTDHPSLIAYFTRRGEYAIEDVPDGPPAAHLAAVEEMKAHAAGPQGRAGIPPGHRPAVASQDAHNPGATNYP